MGFPFFSFFKVSFLRVEIWFVCSNFQANEFWDKAAKISTEKNDFVGDDRS